MYLFTYSFIGYLVSYSKINAGQYSALRVVWPVSRISSLTRLIHMDEDIFKQFGISQENSFSKSVTNAQTLND